MGVDMTVMRVEELGIDVFSGPGIARHGIALAAFANQFQNYHRAPVAHPQKITEM